MPEKAAPLDRIWTNGCGPPDHLIDAGNHLSRFTTSPSFGVQRARSVKASTVSRTNCTSPSPKTGRHPPVWELNGSSFGPQVFSPQEHIAGPPSGVLLLFTRAWLVTV